MKNQDEKTEKERPAEKQEAENKSVCGCPFHCSDWDTHQALALGGNSSPFIYC